MIPKKGSILLVLVLVGAAISYASDYKIKTVKILPIESYPARTTISAITIAADPYDTDQKTYKAFDVRKLNSKGYFPLHIIIKNSSRDFLKIQTRNILLVTATGQHLYSTPASVLVEDVIGTKLSGKIPILKSDNMSTAGTPGSPLYDFSSKELTNRIIDPGSVTDGFLFFFTSHPKNNPFAGSSLYIPKLEQEGTGKGIGPFVIPLDPALQNKK